MAQDLERRLSKRGRCWLRRIHRWQQSGLTQTRFCREHQLSISAFRWWRYRLIREGFLSNQGNLPRPVLPASKTPPFVEIAVSESRHSWTQYEIHLSGQRQLVIPEKFDDHAVARLISILEQRC